MFKTHYKELTLLISILILLKLFYLILNFSLGADKTLYSTFKKNDSYWYEKISENGYREIRDPKQLGYSNKEEFIQSEWAFFPLYPATVNAVKNTFNSTWNQSALIISFIFSFAAIIAMYLFTFRTLEHRGKSFYTCLLMMLFPFSFYISMFYTEALFLSLLIFSFLAISYQRPFVFILLSCLLVLVRPNGVVLLLPLFLYYLEKNRILQEKSIQWKLLFHKKNLIGYGIFIFAPLVFLGYCFYQQSMTDHFFAFSAAQKGWYKEFMIPIFSFFRHGDAATQFNSVYTILIIILIGFTIKKMATSLKALTLISVLLPLCAGSVISMSRYISSIFPLFIVWGSSLYQSKFRWAVIACLALLHFTSFYFWIINHPIGM